MLVIFSEDQHSHQGLGEFWRGQMVPCFDNPERPKAIISALRQAGLGKIQAPAPILSDVLLTVHDPQFIRFLETAWENWSAMGRQGDALPSAWTTRTSCHLDEPATIDGRLAFYATDAAAPIGPGTMKAALASAASAIGAADRVLSGIETASFALCRPPGHHAGRNSYGGYCYLNNAALAAQRAIDAGCDRVAVLDIDYHHGNGTQDIFFSRRDVFTVSLHGDPSYAFPYFSGSQSERGLGTGQGFNLNLPLPAGTKGWSWLEALALAVGRILQFGPDCLVVSLGFDTAATDAVSEFMLEQDDYLAAGRLVARVGTPTVFILEGGYDVAGIGTYAAKFFTGYLN